MIQRVCAGFDQLARQSHYLDFPAYDALRQLGPEENAWSTIPLEDEVLVLCSYADKHFSLWESLRRKLKRAPSECGITTDVLRLQDLATPQLVSQSLYERIRRSAGCVADWTGGRPSAFLELGARLAVSRRGVVQIADEKWFQSGEPKAGHYDRQLERMRGLLSPLEYAGVNDPDIGMRIARQLVTLRSDIEGSWGHPLRRVLAQALRSTERPLPEVPEHLMSDADSLDYPDASAITSRAVRHLSMKYPK